MDNKVSSFDEISDEELEQLGIQIPLDETDESFFMGIDKIIQEEFGEEK